MPATLNIVTSGGKSDNGSKDLTKAVKDLTEVINGGPKVKGGKRQQKKQAKKIAEASAIGIPTTQKEQDAANKKRLEKDG